MKKWFLFIAIPAFLLSQNSIAQKGDSNPMRVWFDEPAKFWEEAVPLGNGFLGAMVYGSLRQPNSFFEVAIVKEPVISKLAQAGMPVLKPVSEYDLPTGAGKTYSYKF